MSTLLSGSYHCAITATDQTKSFYHYGRFKGLLHEWRFLFCMVTAREHKKSILGCTF